MPTTTHPAPEQLASFVRGELAPGELDEIAGHVRSCDSCCVAVQRARADTLVVVTPGPAEVARVHLAPALTAKVEPLPLKVPAALLDHPQYQIIGQLGEGGMGVVYKAEHRMMGRVVALKVIAPKLTSKATVVARFVKEVKAAARLTHPNIVTAYDAGEAGGLHFLVMEFVEGISLDRFVARRGGTLPVSLACQFTRQAAIGLQHAHEQGMVHRDIKPANLMVTRKGHIKILDFGLARLVQDENQGDGPAATTPNLVMGTPDYLSPEQARNSHTVDIRSDIYSLGCTLYYLLSGHVPFSNATTLIEKLVAHTREEAPPIQSSRLDVPDALVVVLAKMMAKRPDDRYSTPAEAAAALAPFARGPGLGAMTNPGMSGVLGRRTDSPAASQPVSVELVEAELVEAELVALPTAPTSATPTKLSGDVHPATPQGPPTRSPSRKKKARPPAQTPRWAKWVALLTVIFGGVVVGAMIPFLFTKNQTPREVPSEAPKALAQAPAREEKAPPPAPPPANSATRPTAKQDPVKPTPPVPVTPPPHPQKVLFILPHKGLWFNDYERLRSELEKLGHKTVTGAPGKAGSAELFSSLENRGTPVEIQMTLTETTDLAEFAAVVICGRDVKGYWGESREAKIVKSIIQQMLDKSRFVIGVGLGQEVLVKDGFLRGQKAASTDHLLRTYPTASSGIDWRPETDGPVKSGQIVTIGHPYSQAKKAAALLPWPTPNKK